MDIEQAKTFLAIITHGSFLEASKHLHVTQSTVSARISSLENYLDTKLFVRNRSGATLTQAGRRFLTHAKNLISTMEQARHDIGLPSRYVGKLRIGGRIALWENFLPACVGRIRQEIPDISILSEIGFEEDLVNHLVEGTLDIGLMYTPRYVPDLLIEKIFDETLVYVSTDPSQQFPDENYIHVNWGPGFYEKHREHYPDMDIPAQVVNIGWLAIQLALSNGGSCFLPRRMAQPLIDSKKLHEIHHAPEFKLPAYMVFSRSVEDGHLHKVINIIREMSEEVQ
ncbi:MAG: LysR family transcriptional regulator [Gammaproteobacteria bacterium]|jgi:LysR family transcriptional regulator, flagellar master operon regulator